MSDKYKIKALNLGTIIRAENNLMLGGSDKPLKFPLIAFLLESPSHKVLIDLGGSPADGVHWMPYTQEENENISAALKNCGISLEEIDTIIFTHLHWDHAGCINLFPNATLFAQKAECTVVYEGKEPGYEYELVKDHEYIEINGDTDSILPGISVILTPGHSYGSQSIIVDNIDGKVIICGDLFPTYRSVKDMIPNGRLYDEKIIRESMQKVLDLNIQIIPGHDFEVLNRY